MIENFKNSGGVGCFLCVKPSQSFSIVSIGERERVEEIAYVRDTNIIINGGYFIFQTGYFSIRRRR